MAHLLVVDDDANIRFLLQEELSAAGHWVRSAADGPSGLEAAAKELPDLVILDLKMPGMGGLEVLRRLKETQPGLPVLLFTAYSDFRDDARSLGADGYLVKSHDLAALTSAVGAFLARAHDDTATRP